MIRTIYRLYVTELDDWQEKVAIAKLGYNGFSAYSSAIWTADGQLYMIVVQGLTKVIKQLLWIFIHFI